MLEIFLTVFLVCSIAINIGTGILLARAARRLLEFDSILTSILPELELYSIDLKRLSSGDVMVDHPEVLEFHRRNLKALKSLESIVDSIVSTRPVRSKAPPLPRPDIVG